MSSPPLVSYQVQMDRISGTAPVFSEPGSIRMNYSLDSVPPFNFRETPYVDSFNHLEMDELFAAEFIPPEDLLPEGYIFVTLRLGALFYAPDILGDERPGYASHLTLFCLLRWRLGLKVDDEYIYGDWFERQMGFNSKTEPDPETYDPPAQVTTDGRHQIIVEKSFKSPCGFSSFINIEKMPVILFGSGEYRLEVAWSGYIEVHNFAVYEFVSFDPPSCQAVLESPGGDPCECCCCGGAGAATGTIYAATAQIEAYAQLDNQGL